MPIFRQQRARSSSEQMKQKEGKARQSSSWGLTHEFQRVGKEHLTVGREDPQPANLPAEQAASGRNTRKDRSNYTGQQADLVPKALKQWRQKGQGLERREVLLTDRVDGH